MCESPIETRTHTHGYVVWNQREAGAVGWDASVATGASGISVRLKAAQSVICYACFMPFTIKHSGYKTIKCPTEIDKGAMRASWKISTLLYGHVTCCLTEPETTTQWRRSDVNPARDPHRLFSSYFPSPCQILKRQLTSHHPHFLFSSTIDCLIRFAPAFICFFRMTLWLLGTLLSFLSSSSSSGTLMASFWRGTIENDPRRL